MVLRIFKIDCHQWLSDSFRMLQICFRPGLRLGPQWGSLQHSPDPVTGLWGLSLLLRGGRGKGEGKGNGRKEEGKRRDAPPLRRFLDLALDVVQWLGNLGR